MNIQSMTKCSFSLLNMLIPVTEVGKKTKQKQNVVVKTNTFTRKLVECLF